MYLKQTRVLELLIHLAEIPGSRRPAELQTWDYWAQLPAVEAY